jgi:hypothetical protein
MRYLRNVLNFIISLFESPISAGILSFVIYAIIAAQRGSITGSSSSPYFNYLADAFLHGQLSLRLIPTNQHDLAFFNGQYFMYWPPFPAIFLMPFIALFGIGFSDVFITLLIGALNVTLVSYTFRLVDKQNLIPIGANGRGILTIFFAFGTVHLFLSSLGIVWFTSQVIAFLSSILAFLAAIRLKGYAAFFLTGLAIACATLTRNNLIFLGIWPAYFLLISHKHVGWRKLISYFAIAAIPILAAIFFSAAYDYLRFGNFIETGVTYMNLGSFFESDFQKYGQLNIHYFVTDFYYNFVYYPFPVSNKTLMGGSLFLLSPFFIAAFWTLIYSDIRKQAVMLWITSAAVAIPILLNIGTGWQTFGPRYTLDFTIPLLFLTALGSRNWPKWLKILLVIISIAQYLFGTVFFIHTT